MAFGGLGAAVNAFMAAKQYKDAKQQRQQDYDIREKALQAQLQRDAAYQAYEKAVLQNEQDRTRIDMAKSGYRWNPQTGQYEAIPSTPLPKNLSGALPPNHGDALTALQNAYNRAAAQSAWYAQQSPTPENINGMNVAKAAMGHYATLITNMQTQRGAMARDKYTQGQENTRHGKRDSFEAWLHGQPTYRDLHPSTGRGRTAQPADVDTITQAEARIAAAGANAQAMADGIIAKVIAHGGSPKTVAAIHALGAQYQRQWNTAHPQDNDPTMKLLKDIYTLPSTQATPQP